METVDQVRSRLLSGCVIPAHPLALNPDGSFSIRYQTALSRYYVAAGAGGLAVGVHTTQFEIRDVGLYKPVLECAADAVDGIDTIEPPLMIAGVAGATHRAAAEAELARDLGYDAGLLSLAALQDADDDQLIDHCKTIAEIIPVFGFYLQPAVGGRLLDYSFWRRFMEIPEVVAVKVSPFNRYQSLDVIRALSASGRGGDISLYTGNDDTIVSDLLAQYDFGPGADRVQFSGGLLGHWSFWTRRAVEHLTWCKKAKAEGQTPANLLTLGAQLTDVNAAVFDAANGYAGCVAGINYMLFRQGLLPSIRCLNDNEVLSHGQLPEIERIVSAYPHLSDDEFVSENLDDWLG